MRVHSDILTTTDIHTAARAAGRGVLAYVLPGGSRSHARAFDVKLTGTSSRRPNPGAGNGQRDDADSYAATWDEWGMFLAALYAVDEAAVWGSVGCPIYADAASFHYQTGDRFESLTPPFQHLRHRWIFADGEHKCESCEAVTRRP